MLKDKAVKDNKKERPLKICTWCHCEARERRGNLSDVNSL